MNKSWGRFVLGHCPGLEHLQPVVNEKRVSSSDGAFLSDEQKAQI